MEYHFIDKSSSFRAKYKTDSDFKMKSPHFHSNIYELFVIVAGTRKLITKDCLFELQPKSTFLIKPGVPHKYIDGEFSKFSSMHMEIPRQWLNTYLAEHPSKDTDVYLITPNDVKTIGKKCGYKSLSHFNHTFKNHTGLTPIKYRKQKQ